MNQTKLDPVTVANAGGFHFEDYRPGQRVTSRGRTITHADIRLFQGATGTDHSIHTDEEYCRDHPILKGVCAPGLLLLSVVDAFLAETLTRRMASVVNYGHDRIRYLKPVYCHDTIRVEFEIAQCTEKDDAWGLVRVDGRALNQHDEAVLFDAHVLLVGRG